MEYALTRMVLSPSASIPISQEEYDQIAGARDGLLEALYIEEKFDLLTEDLAEFESELINRSLRDMIFGEHSDDKIQSTRYVLNRRLVHLLSAARLYVDQVKHHVGKLSGNNLFDPNRLFSEKYDSSSEYRIMEALRNYTQHRGLLIHRISFDSRRIDGKDESKIRFMTSVYVDTNILKQDAKIKKCVLNEMNQAAQKNLYELAPAIRRYIAELSEIHHSIRSAVQSAVSQNDGVIQNAINRYAEAEATILGLAAVKTHANGSRTDPVYVLKALTERRQHLQKKNGNLVRLSSRYVSSESMS